MFILTCSCGNEIFCNEEDRLLAWQCEECGQWYDFFGTKIPAPVQRPAAPPSQYYYDQDDDEKT